MVETPRGIIIESDIMIKNVKTANPLAIILGPYGGGHNDRACRFQFKFNAADGSPISMQEMQWEGTGSNFSAINSFDTDAKVGEWFKLRIEYDAIGLAATGSPETRVYINDKLVYKTNEVYSKAIEANDPSAAATIIMFTPLVCELWLDNTSVRQFE